MGQQLKDLSGGLQNRHFLYVSDMCDRTGYLMSTELLGYHLQMPGSRCTLFRGFCLVLLLGKLRFSSEDFFGACDLPCVGSLLQGGVVAQQSLGWVGGHLHGWVFQQSSSLLVSLYLACISLCFSLREATGPGLGRGVGEATLCMHVKCLRALTWWRMELPL